MTLAEILLATTVPQTAAIRAWLPTARRYVLTPADLARIDSYGSTDGRTLHAQLPLVLPMPGPVWYEAETVAAGGTTMLMGYGGTPAGPGELAVWLAVHARGTDRLIGPLGPLRLDATSIDAAAEDTPTTRELRVAAGIVFRALLLGLGEHVPATPTRRPPGRPPRAEAAADARFTIRLTGADLRRWTAAAEGQGLTLSDLVRESVELAIARGSTR